MNKQVTLSAAVLAAAVAIPSQAAVIWDFDFTDAVGVGFNDLTSGTDRQNALKSAGDYLSGFLTSYDATIQMEVNGSASGGSLLAAAGSNYNTTPPTPNGIHIFADTKIIPKICNNLISRR